MSTYLERITGPIEGEHTWRSPSNIALVKYWGKHGIQLPRNPSISFTLETAFTETNVKYRPKAKSEQAGISIDFVFEGQHNEKFRSRVHDYLKRTAHLFPFVYTFHFEVSSRNSFPHSSGIASSASAFSALALCLCSIEKALLPEIYQKIDFASKASEAARLGSGSACRSIFENAALWGKTSAVVDSTDTQAISMQKQLHTSFVDYRDSILIISKEQKSISSTDGHNMMNNHPFAEVRYAQAHQHIAEILNGLKDGDQDKVGKICEMEAMQLHALMLCSDPNFILLQPNTLTALQRIKDFRESTGIPVYFTLDAGPNVHILYPGKHRLEVKSWIESQLLDLCESRQWIDDKVGAGPRKIKKPNE